MGETQVIDDDRGGTAGRTAGQGVPGGGSLCEAVARLQRELRAYRPVLPDRAVAEDQLDALARQAAGLPPSLCFTTTECLRHSLLLVAAAIGSVSALAGPLDSLREAVEAVAPPR